MTTTYPDAWGAGDKVKVAISKDAGATWVALEPIVSSIKWTPGKKGIDQIVTVDTGRIEKNVPQELCSMEFDAYWTGIEATSGSTSTNIGPSHFFNSNNVISTSTDRYVTSSSGRNKFVVALMYTNDANNLGAERSTAASTASYRIMMNNARMTEMSWSYDDHIGKGSFKFECPAFTKAKLPNYSEEDCLAGSTGALSTMSAAANITQRFGAVYPAVV